MARSNPRNHTHHLDKRLRFRLRLYIVISLILLGILVFNLVRGDLRLNFALLGLGAGTILGALSSRMFHTSWDKDAAKIVSQLDWYGGAILIGYVLIELNRNTIVQYFTHGIQVTTTGLVVLAGIMLGRVLGTRGRIITILKEQQIL